MKPVDLSARQSRLVCPILFLSSAVQPLSAPPSSKVGLGIRPWKDARSEPRTPFLALPGLATPQETSRCVFPIPGTGPLREEEARPKRQVLRAPFPTA